MSLILGRKILFHSSFKSSTPSAISSLYYHSSLVPTTFNFDNVSHQMRRFNFKPRFNFGCIREPDDAIALFQEMVRMRPRPSVIDFTKLLTVVVKMKHFSIVFHMFDEMLRRDAHVDHYTLSIVIDCFCQLKRADLGLAILGSFFKRGHEPTVVTFNSLIKGLMLVGKIEEAERMHETMKQIDVEPNIVTYHTLIDGYCLRGEMDKARNIFDLAVSSGLKPDIRIYSSLMNGYCKKGRMEEVSRLFMLIGAEGLEHNVVSYTIMLQALFRKGRCEDGLKLFKEMEALHMPPNIRTYTVLLDGLCNAHRIAEAFSVLHTIEEKGITPNIVTYSALIEGLCNDDKVREAKDLFVELPSKGLKPNVVTYTILIGALCKEGQIEEAKDLLAQMVSNGCLPNSVTYNVFVQALLKRNKIEEAMPILEEMNSRGFILDPTTFSLNIQPPVKEVQSTMSVQEHQGNDKSCVWHAADFNDGELKDETSCIRFASVENCKTFKDKIAEIAEGQAKDNGESEEANTAASLIEKLSLFDTWVPDYCRETKSFLIWFVHWSPISPSIGRSFIRAQLVCFGALIERVICCFYSVELVLQKSWNFI